MPIINMYLKIISTSLLLIFLEWQIKNPNFKNMPINKIQNIQFNLFVYNETFAHRQKNLLPIIRMMRLQKKFADLFSNLLFTQQQSQSEIKEREREGERSNSHFLLFWLLFRHSSTAENLYTEFLEAKRNIFFETVSECATTVDICRIHIRQVRMRIKTREQNSSRLISQRVLSFTSGVLKGYLRECKSLTRSDMSLAYATKWETNAELSYSCQLHRRNFSSLPDINQLYNYI